MLKENRKYEDSPPVLSENKVQGTDASENIPQQEIYEPEKDTVKAVKKAHKSRKAVQEFLGGDYLSQEWVTGNLSYILYVALLAMIYIANTYNTEKKFNAIERTKSELKELRYEYITTKSILMFKGRQSEISKRAMNQGLREAKMPPYKILYSDESVQSKQP
jgi:hypothetical protein